MMYTGCLEYVKSKSQSELGELTDLWKGEGCCYNFVKFI